MKKNILILAGGGGTEHEVSIITAKYIKSQLDTSKYNPLVVEIEKDLSWKLQGEKVELSWNKKLIAPKQSYSIDAAIPWLHGYPGETGHVTAFFDLIGLPYLGCQTESHMICFNKVLTKLWCNKVGIPCTEFDVITSMQELERAKSFFDKYGRAFVKASNQGSSVGCYPVTKKQDLETVLPQAFKYSDFVIIERLVEIRELEISVFDYKGKTHATDPCEIQCPDKFYSYEEKYSNESHTKVDLVAQISADKSAQIKAMALKAYSSMKLRHGVRMDFFLEDNGNILLNEINTYPGMTPVSMFPKMMSNYGVEFKNFLDFHLEKLSNSL